MFQIQSDSWQILKEEQCFVDLIVPVFLVPIIYAIYCAVQREEEDSLEF